MLNKDSLRCILEAISHAWWPCELLATDDVNVEMVDGLAAVLAFVDYCAVA